MEDFEPYKVNSTAKESGKGRFPGFRLGGWEALLLFGGLLAGQLVVAAIGLFMLYGLHIDFKTSTAFMMLSYPIAMLFPIGFIDLFCLREKGLGLNFNFTGQEFSTWFWAFGMMVGMMLVSEYIVDLIPTSGKLLGPVYRSFMEQMSGVAADNVSMIILTCIFAPLLEEILFRGIILRGIYNKKGNSVAAILISAFVFGAMHGYPWQFAGAFLLGIVLGIAYLETGSLLVSIYLHAFNNFVSCMMIMHTKSQKFSEVVAIPRLWLFFAGLAVFGLSCRMFLEKYNPQNVN